jgi:hypothetical protein
MRWKEIAMDAERELEETKQELSDFRQEVSDSVSDYLGIKNAPSAKRIHDFIIPAPNPDPLVEVLRKALGSADRIDAICLRAALDDQGFKIVEVMNDE